MYTGGRDCAAAKDIAAQSTIASSGWLRRGRRSAAGGGHGRGFHQEHFIELTSGVGELGPQAPPSGVLIFACLCLQMLQIAQVDGDLAARAILILDALSLRELPWLLQGAKERGFTLHTVAATASELPSETNPFARALGLASRSQLQANGGGLAHKLQPAQTETIDLPWKDCAGLVGNASGAKNWVFWHHWPDAKLHDYGAGQGLELLTKDAAQQLTSDDFWGFVERLATGRRLVITSDHGYAATGYFPDADGEVAAHLKQTFSSGRSKAGNGDAGPFVPPVALQIDSPHGAHLLALGRRKWRSQGGYPTLTHGGLSLLEVLSPWIEISK